MGSSEIDGRCDGAAEDGGHVGRQVRRRKAEGGRRKVEGGRSGKGFPLQHLDSVYKL